MPHTWPSELISSLVVFIEVYGGTKTYEVFVKRRSVSNCFEILGAP